MILDVVPEWKRTNAINNLESALSGLPLKTEVPPGKVVKGAALNYLSELYLAKGIALVDQGKSGKESFEKAVKYATDVIDGGMFHLMKHRFGTRKHYKEGNVYWDLFRIGNVTYQSGNKETIWTLSSSLQAFKKGDYSATVLHPRHYMPALRSRKGFVGIAPENGGRGVATNAPTKYMRFTIWKGKWGDDMRNDSINIQRNFRFNDPTYKYYGEIAPDSVLYTGHDKGMVFPIWWKLSTMHFKNKSHGFPNSNLFRNKYMIRLPETILLRAEAYWRLGMNQLAAADINKIRKRANCEYLVKASDVDLGLILDERARELYIEEKRWSTLLRMGGTVAHDRILKYNYWPTRTAQRTLDFEFSLWPIPQEQIDRNKNHKLRQNPAWIGR